MGGHIGKGSWPAFWSLGGDIDTHPWPACGEIDIMEFSETQMTNGQNTYFLNNPYSVEKSEFLTTEIPVANLPMDNDGFRVYTLEYTKDENGRIHMKMWVTKAYEETLNPGTAVTVKYPKVGAPEDIVTNFDTTFNKTMMNVKLNLAIGGNLGGDGPYF